jgi:hypothetical protein
MVQRKTDFLWLTEGGQCTMKEPWEEKLSCAVECPRCKKKLGPQEQRILSVYDDEPICLDCKKKEEGRSDYGEASRKMIGQCMADVEQQWGDPAGFCYHHFYPYQC